MQQLTANVFAETGLRGCNPGFITTSDGVVVVDTPQLPTRAVAMRQLAESHGPIRYLINTEHHVDHIFGNYYFRGEGTVVHHQGVYDNFMVVTPDLDPFAYAAEAIPTDDPEGAGLFPDREEYYRDPNKAAITFTGDLTLQVGDHTFQLLHTPGHTPGQVAVHIPEERVVFTGDTVFSECQTWLMTSDVDRWLASLDRLAGLDVDILVPGHGPVTNMRLPGCAARGAPGVDQRGGVRHRQGLVAPGDHRAGQLRRPLPGGCRAGLHDGVHPDQERGRALRQAGRRTALARAVDAPFGAGRMSRSHHRSEEDPC